MLTQKEENCLASCQGGCGHSWLSSIDLHADSRVDPHRSKCAPSGSCNLAGMQRGFQLGYRHLIFPGQPTADLTPVLLGSAPEDPA